MTTPLFSSFPHDLEGMLAEVIPELLRYCRSLTGREWEAEDLAQETLIRVLNRHGKMPGIAMNKPYVFRIARNLWIDRCRLGRRHDPRLIYEAYLRLFEHGCRIAEIRAKDDRYFFTLHDPDGNLLMISESFF